MKNKRIIAAAFALAAGVTLCLGPVKTAQKVSAGASTVYVASSSSIDGSSINGGDFFIEGNVTASNGRAIFNKNAAESSLIAKNKVRNLENYGIDTVFKFKSTLCFRSFAENGSFVISFGLDDLDYRPGAENSYAIEVTYSDALYIGVFEYREENVKTALYRSVKFGNLLLNTDIPFNVEVKTDGTVYATVGSTKILTGAKKLAVSPDGFISFTSFGKNEVELTNVEITTNKYDLPENVNYLETFDNGYNANMFYTESQASPATPSSLSVKDGALVFANTADAYISTKYMYSNFELCFDILDIFRTAKYDENGNLIAPISSWMGIEFAMDSYRANIDSRYATFLQIGQMPDDYDYTKEDPNIRYVLWDNSGTYNGLLVKPMSSFNFWDEEFVSGETVNVKFTVIDGIVTFSARIDGDIDWTEILSYNMGNTKSGYIRIMTWGGTSLDPRGLAYNRIGNFTIDNLSIKNMDYESVKNVVEAPEYKSNLRDKTPDYAYVSSADEKDLLDSKIERKDMGSDGTTSASGCSSSVSGVLFPLLAVGVIALFKKKERAGE